jgi:hypothetical protein
MVKIPNVAPRVTEHAKYHLILNKTANSGTYIDKLSAIKVVTYSKAKVFRYTAGTAQPYVVWNK